MRKFYDSVAWLFPLIFSFFAALILFFATVFLVIFLIDAIRSIAKAEDTVDVTLTTTRAVATPVMTPSSVEMIQQDIKVLSLEEQIVLAMAQICVSEANWSRRNDCPAIHQVLRRRMHFRGDPNLLVTAQAYCPHATGAVRPETVRQRWVAGLNLDALEPDGWRQLNRVRRRQRLLPLDWNNFVERWQWRISEARELLARPRRVCRGVVDHWGARWWDRSHLGWRRVNCGPTIEAFWRIPR